MKKTHGLSKTRFYGIWNGMMMRCYNPNRKRYNIYGGRGIKVEKRWHTFQNFYDDMYPSYKAHLTIDRINVNGNYTRKNCRWATKKEQMQNKRTSVYVEINGERMTASQAAEKYGMKNAFTIYTRVNNGYVGEELIYGKQWKQMIEHDGKRITIAQASKISGVGKTSIRHRLTMEGIDKSKICLSKLEFNQYLQSIGKRTSYV